MLQRVKQFFAALNATVNPDDYTFVQTILNPEQETLFRGMDRVDQRHCLDVARTCQQLVEMSAFPLDRTLLYKAALLHDVAKRNGRLKLWDRVLVVLLQTSMPGLFNRLATKSQNPCYIAKNHPAIGAKLCREIGCEEQLVRLIELHHKGGSGKELEILMQADSLN